MDEIPGIKYADINLGRLETGYSKIDITPTKFPIKLTSYGQTAQNALDPLYAKALSIGNQVVMVSIDLLFIPIRLYKRLAHLCPILLLHATHAHATPSPINPEYQSFLEGKLSEVITESMLKLEPSNMTVGHSKCNLAMNRRRPIRAWKNLKKGIFRKTIEVRPNEKGPTDNTLTVVNVHRETNDVKLINYACHATMWHGSSVSADWPGRISVPGEYMFVQGFMGNVIPYYKRERNNWKDRVIALYEGTKDFRKAQTTEKDMNHAGQLIGRAANGITEYRQIG